MNWEQSVRTTAMVSVVSRTVTLMLRLSAGMENGRDAVPLARRARVDRVEAVQRKRERVGLVELERVVRLRLDVHAYHVEARPVVADGRAPGSAEQVEEDRAASCGNPSLVAR